MKATISTNMPFSEYRQLRGVNASLLADMAKSPLHAKASLDGEDKDTPSKAMGRALHAMILEPGWFGLDFAVWSGGRRGTNAYKEWAANQGTRQILTKAEVAKINAMAAVVLAHPIAGPIVRHKARVLESVIQWQHPATGIPCKSRLDLFTGDDALVLADIKTARDISERGFQRDAMSYQYPLKMAFYADALTALKGRAPSQVLLIALRNVEPYDVAVYEMTPALLEYGTEQYTEALDKLIACREADRWPGIAETEILPLDLPTWLERETEAADYSDLEGDD